jgi:hypothetical protein
MENPLGAAKEAKEARAAKESAKVKAARALAEKADPRGH